jgi:hypothetical protein
MTKRPLRYATQLNWNLECRSNWKRCFATSSSGSRTEPARADRNPPVVTHHCRAIVQRARYCHRMQAPMNYGLVMRAVCTDRYYGESIYRRLLARFDTRCNTAMNLRVHLELFLSTQRSRQLNTPASVAVGIQNYEQCGSLAGAASCPDLFTCSQTSQKIGRNSGSFGSIGR